MKIIIAGGRDFVGSPYYHDQIVQILTSALRLGEVEVVSGGCRGADKYGEGIAKELGLPIKTFLPLWNTFGPRAGPMRNTEMAKYADACILLPGGKGTAHMKYAAGEQGIRVFELNEEEEK